MWSSLFRGHLLSRGSCVVRGAPAVEGSRAVIPIQGVMHGLQKQPGRGHMPLLVVSAYLCMYHCLHNGNKVI